MDSMIRATHDTSSAGYHIPDFTTLLSNLTDAVTAAWPSRLSTKYQKVKVLLMSWDKDDLGVDAEIRPLESVFRGVYHYNTEVWKIPSRRSAVELSRKVANIIDEYGREGNLVILYYGGHARPNEQPGGSPVWVANRNRDSPTVQSSIVHSLLGEVDCDVLLLYDSCHAIQAGEASTGKGVVETLAACGFESIAAEVGNHSFTSSLLQELARAAHTTEWLSVVELHRRLINRLQAWMPTVFFTNDSYSVVQVDRHTGQPMFENSRRRTPIYCFLSKKPRTIALSPLPPPPQPCSVPDEPFVLLNPPTSEPEISTSGPGILLACRLRDQTLDVETWKEWLLTAPQGAQNIQISAIYPSFSALLILELPLVVWDLLPPSPALSFIGYTTGKNHATEFRRTLGIESGDLSEMSDLETDDKLSEDHRESTVKRAAGFRKGQQNSKSKSAKKTERASSTLWPNVFNSDRTAVYASEYDPYCLNLAEQHQDETLGKAERIIRVFTQDVGDPSSRYICDEIAAFCAPAIFESLVDETEESPELAALVDERSPPFNEGPGINGIRLLGRTQLFDALFPGPKSPPLLIETESKDDRLSPRRRLVYVTNLDSTSTLALVATASRTQAIALKEFMYKHITFQSGMNVKLQSSGTPCFQLSFHLPFFAWRRGRDASFDTRLTGDGQTLRNSRNVSFLTRNARGSDTYIHEAQISCMVVGVDNRFWTAYGFFDTYHDGGDGKHDVQYYEPVLGEIPEDPLTGGRHASDTPIWTAREYFLRVMECCVNEAKEEWQNVGQNLLKTLKSYTNNPRDADWKRIQRVGHQTVQLMEQVQQGLYETVAAWDRFQESDLSYFDLDDGTSADGSASAPRTSVMIKNIENDFRELRVLGETMTRQTETFKTFTSALITLNCNRNGEKTNALVTTGISFLPFGLMALVSSAPDILVVQFTPARYAISTIVVACLAAALFLAMFNFAFLIDRAHDLVGHVRGLRGPRAPEDEDRRQIRGGAWQNRLWATGGPDYGKFRDEDSETESTDGAHRLPF